MILITVSNDFKQHKDSLPNFTAFNNIISEMVEIVGNFMLKITTDNPFPGSYGKIQIMQDETTPIDAIFDVFPSGYIHAWINGKATIYESHRSFLKSLK